MIPNKKVDQGADGFIYSSYKKCYSPSRKFFYNSKCRSYIHIPEAKHGPKLVFQRQNTDVKYAFLKPNMGLTHAFLNSNMDLKSASLKTNADYKTAFLQKITKPLRFIDCQSQLLQLHQKVVLQPQWLNSRLLQQSSREQILIPQIYCLE